MIDLIGGGVLGSLLGGLFRLAPEVLKFLDRKNYAGIGFTYDAQRDAFIPPQPYPSWVLNETTCQWEATVPYPDDGQQYLWDEAQQKWVPA